MTREEFNTRYLQTIQQDIDNYARYAEHEEFDILFNLSTQSQFCYQIFYNLTDDPSRFDELCKVYSFLNYCWKDDGDVSLVYATIQYKEGGTTNRFFVTEGCRDEIPPEEISKIALKHGPEHSILIKYSAMRFYEDDLKFLYSLVPDVMKQNELGRANQHRKYFKAGLKIAAKVGDHVKINNHYTWKLNP